MTAKLTLDKAGRLVLPKPMRDELRLGPGDCLAAEVKDQRITLLPIRTTSALIKERGVWVYRTGEPLRPSVVDETLRRVREEERRGVTMDNE